MGHKQKALFPLLPCRSPLSMTHSNKSRKMKVKANRLSLSHPAVLWYCGVLRLMWMSHSICCKNEALQDGGRMGGSGSGHSYQGKAHRPEMVHLHGLRPLLLGSLPSDLQAEHCGVCASGFPVHENGATLPEHCCLCVRTTHPLQVW